MTGFGWKIPLVLALVAMDQTSKWATETMLPWQGNVSVLPFFSLFRTHNYGVAFSMLDNAGPWPLVGLTVLITAFIIWMWRKTHAERWLSQLGFALIVSGALGNLIDRAWHGYVIDMIRIHTETWSFAIFNVADSFITIGAILVVADEVLPMLGLKPKSKQDTLS